MGDVHVAGKKFSIIGAARSGIAAARLLRARGATVFVSDAAPEQNIRQAIAVLNAAGVAFECGGNTQRVLEADVIVLSPGVPGDIPIVGEAIARGLKVVSEVELASWFCTSPIVAVTGTNGKTTTTTLTGRIFEDARKPVVVAGNIGVAFSQVVDTLTPETAAVLEVSSFQLERIDTFRPKVAVILNITPDHLDRYEHSFEKYIAAKCRVFENQREGDYIVYNMDDSVTRTHVESQVDTTVHRLPFSTVSMLGEGACVTGGVLTTVVDGERSEVTPTTDVSIRGRHNLQNAMAASLVAKAMGISTASLRATLRNFKGVEHRLEFVREVNGVMYVNDSKATNVNAVWYALQSYPNPIVVLMGGRDKGNDYTALNDLVKKHVKAIVAIGESADKVVAAFTALKPVEKADTMAEAVRIASALATAGDVVLLSPACASFDWFENYEHRGRVFKELVMQL
jgi:UDP-N-acetylmuramoylalanine--D-glutamate ligase